MTNAKLSPAMRRAMTILEQDGYVDTVDRVTVGTIVALMRRGILREATPLSHGLGACRHYPATTPEQVLDEAYALNEMCCTLNPLGHPRSGCPGVVTPPVESNRYPSAEVDQEQRLKVGDLVQRVSEQGPDAPTGKVLEVRDWPIVGTLVKVTFEGTAATQKQVDELVKVEQETPEQRAARHALDRPLIEAFRAMIPNPHPMENCGPLSLKLAPGDSCPTCGTVLPITPAEQRTGVSDVQASIADEVAALRVEIEAYFEHGNAPKEITAHLDRIAALVPQRATGTNRLPLWLHACGAAHAKADAPVSCSWCYKSGTWRALYTVAGR